MRIAVSLICALCLNLTAWCQHDTGHWKTLAEGMSKALISNFWGASFADHPDRFYFNYLSQQADLKHEQYWPQAHAMDVMVDAYLRTGDKRYRDIYPLWWQGAPDNNFVAGINDHDHWWNPYVDDMEWIALAQIRMWESTGNQQYITKARQLYDDYIWSTWGPENEAPWFGGITWKVDIGKSKNSCSNGPAALIAARLYRFYDKAKFRGGKVREAYLNEAVKIYNWQKSTLFDRSSGAVWDNINSKGEIAKHMVFTYNIGTFLGAAHELYGITGDCQYLDDAVLAATYVINHMTTNDGTLSDAPGGDGGLFHGIFFRYFVKLINDVSLNTEIRRRFHAYITNLATVMASEGINQRTMLYAGRWHQAPADNDIVPLTSHLTGCMLMEAMCILQPVE